MAVKKKKAPSGSFQGMYFLLFLLFTLGIYIFLTQFGSEQYTVAYTDFLTQADAGNIKSVYMQDQKIEWSPVGKTQKMHTFIPAKGDPALLPLLKAKGITITAYPTPTNNGGSSMIWWIVGFTLIAFLFWGMSSKGAQGGGPGGALNFGKSKAKMHKDTISNKKFSDVAGCEEAKQDLEEVVEFLKDTKRFSNLGARIPKGVLLVGSPGTGKTLLAKAVAGEANVPFFSVSGSEFVEMFVGVGASRVRDLFAQGRKSAPCIIFIDELDAVGRARGSGLGGSHDEREQTLNQILVEMDGFDSSEGLILIAATNRPDVLDPALLRPGRFDRTVVVDVPDIKARKAILEVHSKKVPLQKGVDLEEIAKGTPGFTGAELENLINEAALKVGREKRKEVTLADLNYAKERVMMGPERKSMVLKDEEKLTTAYHEAGHAVVGYYLPHTDTLHKITIVPRGRALGMTTFLPDDDGHSQLKIGLNERLAMAMGGRAAEALMFGEEYISSGASGDIQMATQYARSMVCEWGMSDLLGPVQYGEKEGSLFLGKDLMSRKTYSETVHEEIDSEIKRIITKAYDTAYNMLKEHKDQIIALAEELIDVETLDKDDVEKILGVAPKDKDPILKRFRAKVKPIKKENEDSTKVPSED